MKKLYFLLLGLIVMASCGKKPVSVCTADKTTVIAGEQVYFTGDQSTDAYYYHWKFGDGTSARVANPVHSFEKAGIYEVLLHVSNKGGDYWDNNADPLTIFVYGYNPALIKTWIVAETDSTQYCGNTPNYYTLSISASGEPDQLIIDNLGNYFTSSLTGKTVQGNVNKLEISEGDVMSKSGITYNVNGNVYVDGSTLHVLFSATPSSIDSCGWVKGYGLGAK
jgi:PKD repeat protein